MSLYLVMMGRGVIELLPTSCELCECCSIGVDYGAVASNYPSPRSALNEKPKRRWVDPHAVRRDILVGD